MKKQRKGAPLLSLTRLTDAIAGTDGIGSSDREAQV